MELIVIEQDKINIINKYMEEYDRFYLEQFGVENNRKVNRNDYSEESYLKVVEYKRRGVNND